MTKQDLIAFNLECKDVASDLLADFIEMVGDTPTADQQIIIDRYRDAIARGESNIRYLQAAK